MNLNPFASGGLPVELSPSGLHSSPRFSLQRSIQMLLAVMGVATDPRQTRKVLSITPTLAAEAHSAQDSLFAATEIPNIVDDSGGTCMLREILCLNKADTALVIDLMFFRANVTSWGAAGAAIALDDTDLLQSLGHISFAAGDYFDVGGARVGILKNVNMILKPTTGTSIWVAGGTGAGTPTPALGDLTLKFLVER